MTLSRKNLMTVVGGALALAVIAYLFLGGGDGTVPVVSPQGAAGTAAEVRFSSLVAELNGLSFETAILSDERFLSLIDIRTAVVPEAAGRADPFAPLAGE